MNATPLAPRVLTAAGDERCRLHPTKLSLHKRLSPLSTAEMQLPPDDPALSVRELVALSDASGDAGIFRVVSIDETIGELRTVHLEHSLATLADGMVPAMTVSEPVRTALNRLLACQSQFLWQLGELSLDETFTLTYTVGHTNLLTAFLEVIDLLPGHLTPVFDQTAMPWTLHLLPLSDEDACEGRITRNLVNLRIQTDSSDLCTRIYPYGAGQGTTRVDLTRLVGQEYLDSPNASIWGIISRSFTAENIFEAATLRAVAEKYLERHSMPRVSIEADAVDLSAITGEDADSFQLGRMCRLVLPEAGYVLHERVIAIDEPDVFGAPGQMRLTLCSHVHDTADELADMLRDVQVSQSIGGRLRSVTTNSRAYGNKTSSISHFFRIESGWTVLSCTTAMDPDTGVRIHHLMVDGTDVPNSAIVNLECDLFPYLRRTESGQISTGRHTLSIFPDDGPVNSTVTMQVVEHV